MNDWNVFIDEEAWSEYIEEVREESLKGSFLIESEKVMTLDGPKEESKEEAKLIEE